MTEKRFHYRIDEVGIYYYVCDNTKKSDDRIILELDTKFDAIEVCNVLNSLNDENEQLKSVKNDVHDLIDELIKKAERDVEDLRKDAYEKGYAYNPYYYWGVAHGLEKLKKELEE